MYEAVGGIVINVFVYFKVKTCSVVYFILTLAFIPGKFNKNITRGSAVNYLISLLSLSVFPCPKMTVS